VEVHKVDGTMTAILVIGIVGVLVVGAIAASNIDYFPDNATIF
jgi:uncharacterized protein (DUF983 family)